MTITNSNLKIKDKKLIKIHKVSPDEFTHHKKMNQKRTIEED